MTWDDRWRLLNATVCGPLLIWVMVRGILNWSTYTALRRDAWWMTAAWLWSVLIGSLEIIYSPDSYYRLIVVSFAICLTARVVYKNVDVTPKDKEKP